MQAKKSVKSQNHEKGEEMGGLLLRPVIGLEVHIQLASRTKLFSAVPVDTVAGSDAPVNTRVAHFVSGKLEI
jgi:Glu-tRNA(Gln) amidotransferase subunit E-like FAD-binding protein